MKKKIYIYMGSSRIIVSYGVTEKCKKQIKQKN